MFLSNNREFPGSVGSGLDPSGNWPPSEHQLKSKDGMKGILPHQSEQEGGRVSTADNGIARNGNEYVFVCSDRRSNGWRPREGPGGRAGQKPPLANAASATTSMRYTLPSKVDLAPWYPTYHAEPFERCTSVCGGETKVLRDLRQAQGFVPGSVLLGTLQRPFGGVVEVGMRSGERWIRRHTAARPRMTFQTSNRRVSASQDSRRRE
jgi:hypothetical protein